MCRAVFTAPNCLQYRTAHQSVTAHWTQCRQRSSTAPQPSDAFHKEQLHPASCNATNGSVGNTGRIATDRPTWSLHKAFFSYFVNNATFCCWFPAPSLEHKTAALNTCQFPAATISPIRVPAGHVTCCVMFPFTVTSYRAEANSSSLPHRRHDRDEQDWPCREAIPGHGTRCCCWWSWWWW